jgi:hypothetical protein
MIHAMRQQSLTENARLGIRANKLQLHKKLCGVVGVRVDIEVLCRPRHSDSIRSDSNSEHSPARDESRAAEWRRLAHVLNETWKSAEVLSRHRRT